MQAMTPLLVLNVVGLTRALLAKFPGKARALESLAREGQSCTLGTVLPAVTCSAQATFLTGQMPREHGIVANGWYFRELAEVHFWKQSNYLVGGEKVWDAGHARDPQFTSAQICWWYNMYSANDIAVTMRPVHKPDGGLVSLLYTTPPDLALQLDAELGRFPLFDFWGPRAGIASSEWIERCARSIKRRSNPTLSLVYLPHLDYNAQRVGPYAPETGEDLAQVDAIAGRLAHEWRAQGGEVVVLSEYGLAPVSGAVDINRVLRRAGYLKVQEQLTWELLDHGACRAFAVSDHQVAHVYVKEARDLAAVTELLERTAGIERVLDEAGKKEYGLDHPRSGDLVAISAPDKWFTYYFWEDDKKAPAYAHEIEIHAKPGYDPLELFMDPKAPLKMPRMLTRLALRKLGFNVGPIMTFVPFDSGLIKGSHGRLPLTPEEGPLFITSSKKIPLPEHLNATAVKAKCLELIFGA